MSLIDPSKCKTRESAGIERLRALYAVMRGVPSKRVKLDNWRDLPRGNFTVPESAHDMLHPECGTLACAVGWATQHPDFIAEGFKMEDRGRHPVYEPDGLNYFGNWNAVDKFFNLFRTDSHWIFMSGVSDARTREFCSHSHLQLDAEKLKNAEIATPSHKALVLLRIRTYLLDVGAITRKRHDELAAQEANEA